MGTFGFCDRHRAALSPGCGGEFPLYLVSFSQGILSTVALVLKTVLSYVCLLLITQVH